MLNIYKNKKVLITGCNGFKGSWLAFWLLSLGAKITGVSLKNNNEILFRSLKLDKYIDNKLLDITDFNKINNLISNIQPDIIFHLAAQSIVSIGYSNPYQTFNTNIIGSLNILESLKNNKRKIKLIYVTSDKCYKNKNLKRGYNELDSLGGDDPYSMSKSIKEMIFSEYKKNFFFKNKHLDIASVRSGNVIGGGDFSKDRIIPDIMKSIFQNKKLFIRNPYSTRPWQHVLEPLYGYLLLGSKLLNKSIDNNILPSWNFGPNNQDCKNVQYLIDYITKLTNKNIFISLSKKKFIEHNLLKLNYNKSKVELGWSPKLGIDESLDLTYTWYDRYYSKKNIKDFTLSQISEYQLKI